MYNIRKFNFFNFVYCKTDVGNLFSFSNVAFGSKYTGSLFVGQLQEMINLSCCETVGRCVT